MKSINMATIKRLIWEIDQKVFKGDVKKLKNRLPVLYHRGAEGVFMPYKIDVDKRSSIHIGAPGNTEQIIYFSRKYGITDPDKLATAISENILLEIAYDLYELEPKYKEKVIDCTVKKIFGREKNQTESINIGRLECYNRTYGPC